MIYNFTQSGEFELNSQLGQQIVETEPTSNKDSKRYAFMRKKASAANANKSENFLTALQSYTGGNSSDENSEEGATDKFSTFSNDIFATANTQKDMFVPNENIPAKVDSRYAAEHYQNTARMANQNFHMVHKAV